MSTFTIISSTAKGNLLQFIRNVSDFWIPPRCIQDLYSTLRNITVERRPQKCTFSSARLWFCGIVTFFQNRVMYGCSPWIRMMLYSQYDKFQIINICTTYNVWNVHEFYSFLKKHNLTCTWYTSFKTFHLHLKSGVLEASYS